MTSKRITESGMKFGPYPCDRIFHIEKSNTYDAVKEGVKIAEFLLLRGNGGKGHSLWVVEAKLSGPRPGAEFGDFIAQVREKMVNAFSLGWASRLGRHDRAGEELPKPFRKLDLSKVRVRFVLVIKTHKDEWLPHVDEAMKKALRSTVKTWGLGSNSVLVLNEKGARRHDLIAN